MGRNQITHRFKVNSLKYYYSFESLRIINLIELYLIISAYECNIPYCLADNKETKVFYCIETYFSQSKKICGKENFPNISGSGNVEECNSGKINGQRNNEMK